MRRAAAAWAEAVDGEDARARARRLARGDRRAALRRRRAAPHAPGRARPAHRARRHRARRRAGAAGAHGGDGRPSAAGATARTATPPRCVDGSREREATFQERWELALDGPDDAPWRVVGWATPLLRSMTTKADFTEEEWARLGRAPLVAGMAITLADPGGPIEALKESNAALQDRARGRADRRATASSCRPSPRTSPRRPSHRQNPLGGFKPKGRRRGRGDPRRAARGQPAAGREDDARGGARSFASWLKTAAQSAAKAAKEGGFLGFRAELVSEREQQMLDRLAEVFHSDGRVGELDVLQQAGRARPVDRAPHGLAPGRCSAGRARARRASRRSGGRAAACGPSRGTPAASGARGGSRPRRRRRRRSPPAAAGAAACAARRRPRRRARAPR